MYAAKIKCAADVAPIIKEIENGAPCTFETTWRVHEILASDLDEADKLAQISESLWGDLEWLRVGLESGEDELESLLSNVNVLRDRLEEEAK